MKMEPIDALELATQAYDQRLVAVAPRQWGQPSACGGWTVKDLADHVLGGNRLHGRVLGVYAAARDVTAQMQAQRRNAQQQAKEREQLFELQQFQRLTVGRELRMTEMKKENERLRGLLPNGGAEPSDQR